VTRWKIAVLGGILLGLSSFRVLADDVRPPPGPSPEYALGFKRGDRLAAELYRSLGSSIAKKKEGIGAGLAALFPLRDSNFDLGIRYVFVREARDERYPGEPTAFTALTFVFDYFVWPTKVGGLYVGGELGVTDPAADDIFSVYSDYAFVGKFGYEYTLPGKHWSVNFEARRLFRDDAPIKANRETQLFSNGLIFGARYKI